MTGSGLTAFILIAGIHEGSKVIYAAVITFGSAAPSHVYTLNYKTDIGGMNQ